jgi:hypothetical protein
MLGCTRRRPIPAISDPDLARLGLTAQQLLLACRHFDFGPLSAAADSVVNSMAPVGRFVQRKVFEVDVT